MKSRSILILLAIVVVSVTASVYAAIVYNQLSIPVTGNITPHPTTYEDVWAGPTSIAFGDVELGSSSDVKSVVFENIDSSTHILSLSSSSLPTGCSISFFSNSEATTPYSPVSVSGGASLTVYLILTASESASIAPLSSHITASVG